MSRTETETNLLNTHFKKPKIKQNFSKTKIGYQEPKLSNELKKENCIRCGIHISFFKTYN